MGYTSIYIAYVGLIHSLPTHCSKLFAKKVEKLFSSDELVDSPETASSLYRCGICHKLVTNTLDKKLPCLQSRSLISLYCRLLKLILSQSS